MNEEIKQAIHQRIAAPEAEIALSVLTLQLTSEGYNAGDVAIAVADLLNAGEIAGEMRADVEGERYSVLFSIETRMARHLRSVGGG